MSPSTLVHRQHLESAIPKHPENSLHPKENSLTFAACQPLNHSITRESLPIFHIPHRTCTREPFPKHGEAQVYPQILKATHWGLPPPAADGAARFHLQQSLFRAPRCAKCAQPGRTAAPLLQKPGTNKAWDQHLDSIPAPQLFLLPFLPPLNLEDQFINIVGCYQMERRGMPRTDRWLLARL